MSMSSLLSYAASACCVVRVWEIRVNPISLIQLNFISFHREEGEKELLEKIYLTCTARKKKERRKSSQKITLNYYQSTCSYTMATRKTNFISCDCATASVSQRDCFHRSFFNVKLFEIDNVRSVCEVYSISHPNGTQH